MPELMAKMRSMLRELSRQHINTDRYVYVLGEQLYMQLKAKADTALVYNRPRESPTIFGVPIEVCPDMEPDKIMLMQKVEYDRYFGALANSGAITRW
jgi:hypothetical protein